MIAKEVFEKIRGYIETSAEAQDASYLIDKVRELGLDGEVNYMRFQCSYVAGDGSAILLDFRSYDPSGPFQNLPDRNKIKLQLLQHNIEIESIEETFDDKSIYG